MSWKPEMKVVNDENWYPNGLVFETKMEAELYAKDLYSRWTSSTDHRAVESDLEPNYRWNSDTNKLEGIIRDGKAKPEDDHNLPK